MGWVIITPMKKEILVLTIAVSATLSLGVLPGRLRAQTPKDASAGNLVPLPLQLPKPMFEGTPQNLAVPNLEKPLGRPRDPFLAPAGVTNVAKGKKVASSDMEPVIGELVPRQSSVIVVR